MENRKLTPKEQLRKKRFEETEKQLARKGYVSHPLTISILSANLFGFLITLPFIILLGVAFVLLSDRSLWHYSTAESILFTILFIVGIVVHELIHGLTWGIVAKHHFHSIEFGVVWKQLTPYCCCMEALTKFHYILGCVMPVFVLGGLAGIAAVLFSNVLLLLFSFAMILGGGGDLLIILKLLTYRTTNKDVLYHDHPYEVGLVVFERPSI